jgi:excisionase family DNA binding protein
MSNQVLLTSISLDELITAISRAMSDELIKFKPNELDQLEDDLIKIPEVAKILQVSEVTVHTWKKAGKIPFYRISNKVFFRRNEILEALKKIERREV